LCDIALAPHESTAWKLFGNNRGDVAYRRDEPEGTWLNYAVSVIQEADDSDVRIEAVRLAYAAAGEDEQLLSALSRVKSLKESVIAMLTIGEDHPLARGSLGEVILGTLRSLHLDDSNDMQSGLGESEISSLLSELLEVQDRRLRRHAAECFGHIAPLLFCREVSRVHRMHDRMTGEAFIEDCLTGLANADATLGEVYYGSMCPGMMEWLRTEATALQSEHDEVCPVLTPIIAVFPHSATKFLRGLIADLTPPVTSHGTEDIVRHVPSPLNLRLPFVDSED